MQDGRGGGGGAALSAPLDPPHSIYKGKVMDHTAKYVG